MGKRTKNTSQMKRISEHVMLATLASSIVMTPMFATKASALNINASSALLQTKEIVNLTQSVSILESKGWLESANVEWHPVEGATGYNVYYKSENDSDSEYKKIDDKLIRQYQSYFRADIVGISEGSYVIKIVPIINNKEASEDEAVTKAINVKSHTREGFAFSSESPMGTGSGGYNNDGTVADNAQIVYITAQNINSVTADVITNKKGTKTTCTGLVDILAKRQKGYDKNPLIIRMVGEIKSSDINGLNGNGYLQLKGCYNVTFEGVGEDATAYGWGFLIRDAHNVELRNVGVMLFPDDGISLDTDNENIWVHNNDIFYGSAGSDKDQVKGDGSSDVKKSDYVTVSYNHYYDSGKCSLCGMGDSEDFHVTYHHNWFDHSDSRHPRIRVGTVHIYNNYFDGNSKYGVGVTKGSSAFVEANYFRNCKYPMLASLQGTDIYSDPEGTFSGENGGMIKAFNNKIDGAKRLVYANEDSTQFDAYLATTRSEVVPSSYKTLAGGTTYNNFDVSSAMYDYAPDAPENVENNVTTYAGRVNGGDFAWNFTPEDDTSDTVNNELMNKIRNYKSDLISVGGKLLDK
ncbi:pectate lyase [Clostridium sp. SHJSY1]|uniref:pectate lyase family protein n=1 Tax=Clostridium sp. SHJSY1 TaxID=2942483 RepID=UPI0028740771|nr:pectate lyase [Clostridium sp. SHJSY1]MDS0528065.1 pectate lyase [Clostridium sp. SHJSY1]